jgi:hypothetical protein
MLQNQVEGAGDKAHIRNQAGLHVFPMSKEEFKIGLKFEWFESMGHYRIHNLKLGFCGRVKRNYNASKKSIGTCKMCGIYFSLSFFFKKKTKSVVRNYVALL